MELEQVDSGVPCDPKVIKEGDIVLIIEGETRYTFPTISQTAKAKLGKKEVKLNALIGSKYGSWFEILEGKLIPFDPRNETSDLDTAEDAGEKNNKELFDHSTAQKLSQEDIHELKKSGIEGDQLVKKLIENSESFAQKTKFSQDKYVKKKKKKHHIVIQVLKPSSHLICKSYFIKSQDKIKYVPHTFIGQVFTLLRNIRPDTLATIILQSNIRPHSRALVYDKCSGLLVTSFIEKMGSLGTIYNIHNGLTASIPMLRLLGLKETETSQVIKNIPVGCLISNEDESDIEWKQSKLSIKKELSDNLCDSLVICGANDPMLYFNMLYKFLKPSGVFVVYSQYLQPLAEIDSALHLSKEACHQRINETWYREYQVLENRTHPVMQMSATSGYILSGIKLTNSYETNNENKRQKTSD